jgi:competence protein ComEA
MQVNKRNIIIFVVILLSIFIFFSFDFIKKSKEENMTNKYDKIDLSNFTIEEIMKVPGIGIKKATDIKKYAENIGFTSIEDLMKIKGIGEKTYLKIKKYFYLSKSIYTLKEDEKINLNTAEYESLIKLPGIGPESAKKIINYRKIKKNRKLR